MKNVEQMLTAPKSEPPDYKKRYFEKRKKEGLKRIEIWVPVEREEEVKALCRGMIDEKRRAATQST